jgi:hypothetical protein
VTDRCYNPKSALFDAFPKMKALSKRVDAIMEAAEDTLLRRECEGLDTSWTRTILYEAEWRINCTCDDLAASAAVARLQEALKLEDPPGARVQDHEGSFAPSTEVFFLKLDRSTDQLLARNWPWRVKPSFLGRIDDPIRMVTYLQDLCWSDVKRCGQDNRKELNLAISVIARLVLRGGQAGYLSGPGFQPVFERFVRDWQDPRTGFFGVTYLLDGGQEIRTCDLSLTFHMARYVPHLVRGWPTLIETLLAMQDQPYPQGWLDNAKMTDHNNYDVVELFYRGWPKMRAHQRQRASKAVRKMLDWCREASVTPEGKLRKPDKGDFAPDSYYFAAAFLDTIGFFDRRKRFWTDERLPGADAIRNGMIRQLKRFNPNLTVVNDALERLSAGARPFTNAVI